MAVGYSVKIIVAVPGRRPEFARAAQMPLSHLRGDIPCGLQSIGNCRIGVRQTCRAGGAQHKRLPRPDGITARQKSRAGGRAKIGGGVIVGQNCAFAGKPVQVRRRDHRIAVRTYVAITHVIAIDHDEILLAAGGGQCGQVRRQGPDRYASEKLSAIHLEPLTHRAGTGRTSRAFLSS